MTKLLAQLALGALKVFSAFFAWLEVKRHEELGEARAEKRGAEAVKDVRDTLDAVDAGRVPKPDD